MTLTLPYGIFEVPDTDSFAAEVQEEGFWDTDLQPYLDQVLLGQLVIDVGAHVGYYTGYLASRGVGVIAIEGHPHYAPYLLKNIAANGWREYVWVLPIMLYSTQCTLVEQVDWESRASNTWLPGRPDAGPGAVSARRLDDLVELTQTLMKIDPQLRELNPTLLKIDAQGADLHVLLGAERLIQRCHPNILIEYEAALAALHGHTAEDYYGWRDAHGYVETPISGWNAYWVWRG